jgi:hypothetical protein
VDQIIATAISGAVPTLAVIVGFVRNERALARLNATIDRFGRDMNAGFDRLTRANSVDPDGPTGKDR